MTQRQPREEDPAYLAYIRTLSCLVCLRSGPSDPAHLRSASLQYAKRLTGMGEKPDDKWTLPLCRPHHDEQHRQNELSWWASKGIPDPFGRAEELYAGRPKPSTRAKRRPRKAVRVRNHRPVAPGRRLESRPTQWPSRKFRSADHSRKERSPS